MSHSVSLLVDEKVIDLKQCACFCEDNSVKNELAFKREIRHSIAHGSYSDSTMQTTAYLPNTNRSIQYLYRLNLLVIVSRQDIPSIVFTLISYHLIDEQNNCD